MARAVKSKLNPETRRAMAQTLADGMLDTMFGDGMEAEYVWDGFPAWAGLNNISDRELIAEYAQVVEDYDPDGAEDSDALRLLADARAQLRAARARAPKRRGRRAHR